MPLPWCHRTRPSRKTSAAQRPQAMSSWTAEIGLVTKHVGDFGTSTTQGFHRDVAGVIFTDVPKRKFRKVEPSRWLRRNRIRRASFVGIRTFAT